jgi:hypothetical protein
LTPQLQDQLAHLGTWMPFAPAAALLARFTGVLVSPATARRLTEVVGRAGEAAWQAETQRLVEDLPPVPPGPARAVVSVDGAMVPLRGGEWGEVKTLVVGEVPVPPVEPDTPPPLPFPIPAPTVPEVHTTALSYCSRLADVERFNEAVLLELQRRGVENAGQVAAVSDGAEWIQGFVDLHCPQAVRILDFAHAAERVALLGQTLAPNDPDWLTRHLHDLKHTGPEPLLAQWQAFVAKEPQAPPEVAEALAYLDKRRAQVQYPTFRAQGWPIGSGMVESGNKLVVEARLKGAGMHWARANVNPLLVLRNAVCNQRWDETWARSVARLRRHPLPRCPRHPRPLLLPPADPPPLSPVLPAEGAVAPPLPKPHPWRTYGRKLSAKL